MNAKQITAILVGLFFGSAVFAAAPDYSTLTAAVDFSTLITALMSLFVALAGVGIVAKGGGFLVRKIGFK